MYNMVFEFSSEFVCLSDITCLMIDKVNVRGKGRPLLFSYQFIEEGIKTCMLSVQSKHTKGNMLIFLFAHFA